jgi:putative endonuclease
MGWDEVTKDKIYWVYIPASTIGGTLYIGVTNDLVRRVYDHRTGKVPGFTTRYHVHRLVYFEQFGDVENAIRREKRLKKWNRSWKIRHREPLRKRCVVIDRQLRAIIARNAVKLAQTA